MKIGKIRATRYAIRVFLLALLVLGPLGIVPLNGAFPCGFTIFHIELSCPLGWTQRVFATGSPLISLLIASIFFIITTMLFGRFFCSWLCPIGLVNEALHALKEKRLGRKATGSPSHRKLKKAGLDIFIGRRRLMTYFKYSFLVAALVSSFLIKFPVFCLICPVGILSRNIIGIPLLHTWTLELTVVIAVFFSEFFLTDRGWCGALCPMGALFSLLGSLPTKILSLRVQGKPICEKCRRCWTKCPMGIVPSAHRIPDECSNCGLCMETCALEPAKPKLYAGWKIRRREEKKSLPKKQGSA